MRHNGVNLTYVTTISCKLKFGSCKHGNNTKLTYTFSTNLKCAPTSKIAGMVEFLTWKIFSNSA